jgi:hypothetical protein
LRIVPPAKGVQVYEKSVGRVESDKASSYYHLPNPFKKQVTLITPSIDNHHQAEALCALENEIGMSAFAAAPAHDAGIPGETNHGASFHMQRNPLPDLHYYR